jgi:hypothetical protein
MAELSSKSSLGKRARSVYEGQASSPDMRLERAATASLAAGSGLETWVTRMRMDTSISPGDYAR